jgi:hypothetical protein
MANDPTAALAAAVLARLSSPAITYIEGGTTSSVPVQQRVPDELVPAVIVVDGVSLGPSETKGGNDRRALVDIATVYRGRSKASAQAIIGAVYGRLEGQKLTVAGFTVGECRLQSSAVGEEATEANLVHVGRQTFEIIIL